jgi:hypothetical protein
MSVLGPVPSIDGSLVLPSLGLLAIFFGEERKILEIPFVGTLLNKLKPH